MNVTVAASRIQNWWRTQSWVNLVANDPGCDVCGCTSVFSGTLCASCIYAKEIGCVMISEECPTHNLRLYNNKVGETFCMECLYEENSGCPRCGDPYEWAGALCDVCQEERAESRRERQCDRDRYRR